MVSHQVPGQTCVLPFSQYQAAKPHSGDWDSGVAAAMAGAQNHKVDVDCLELRETHGE